MKVFCFFDNYIKKSIYLCSTFNHQSSIINLKNFTIMATTNVIKAAKKEIKNVTKSPLFWLHALNKSAKKGTAIEGLYSPNLYSLWMEANKITRRGFDLSLLPQNSAGQICKLVPATARRYRGGELRAFYGGTYELVPVSMTPNGMIDSIQSYMTYREAVTNDLSNINKDKVMTKYQCAIMFAEGKLSASDFDRLVKIAI